MDHPAFPPGFDYAAVGDVSKFASLTVDQKVVMVQMALIYCDRGNSLSADTIKQLSDEQLEARLYGAERSLVWLRWDAGRGQQAYDPVKTPQAILAFERDEAMLRAEKSARARSSSEAEAKQVAMRAAKARRFSIVVAVVAALIALYAFLK